MSQDRSWFPKQTVFPKQAAVPKQTSFSSSISKSMADKSLELTLLDGLHSKRSPAQLLERLPVPANLKSQLLSPTPKRFHIHPDPIMSLSRPQDRTITRSRSVSSLSSLFISSCTVSSLSSDDEDGTQPLASVKGYGDCPSNDYDSSFERLVLSPGMCSYAHHFTTSYSCCIQYPQNLTSLCPVYLFICFLGRVLQQAPHSPLLALRP